MCARCNLTKKAIEYYESKGLVQPGILENGYRNYGEKDVLVLKEVSVLRRCGVGIAEIKGILNSGHKSAALEKFKYLTEVRTQRFASVQSCVDSLIQNYDIDKEFDYLNNRTEDVSTIKERLVFAFPGNYGLFLSLHFGRFLNEAIDTEQKRASYDAVCAYLDSINLYLSPELAGFLETAAVMQEKVVELQSRVGGNMMKAVADTDRYLEQNRHEIEEYIALRTSDAFKKSPAGQMQKSMLEFQRQSGYQEIWIANMKVLSKSYAEYLGRLEAADKEFYLKFPKAKGMYDL